MRTLDPRADVRATLVQHADGASALRAQRTPLAWSTNIALHRLARLDERLYAHLDGLTVAGDAGYRLAQEALETPGVGQIFTLAVLAIERRDGGQVERLLALVDAVPDAARALISAFGWVSPATLRGFTAEFLNSRQPLQRWIGLAACAAHRVDAGPVLDRALGAEDARERAVALRSAGVLGRPERLAACLEHLDDDDPDCRLAAAASAVRLGSGARALEALRRIAATAGAAAAAISALRLALLSSDLDTARAIVRELAADPAQRRRAIQAAGWAGDPRAVPWLLQQMDTPRHARVAGESFTLLTGADLAALDLEGPTPPEAEAIGGGPTESADDDRVALDEDESLPWPDPARVRAWWHVSGATLAGAATRCFMGAAPATEHLAQVLRTGGQRQRSSAAWLQALAQPGQALFNVAAPAPRQQRLLGLPTRVV